MDAHERYSSEQVRVSLGETTRTHYPFAASESISR